MRNTIIASILIASSVISAALPAAVDPMQRNMFAGEGGEDHIRSTRPPIRIASSVIGTALPVVVDPMQRNMFAGEGGEDHIRSTRPPIQSVA